MYLVERALALHVDVALEGLAEVAQSLGERLLVGRWLAHAQDWRLAAWPRARAPALGLRRHPGGVEARRAFALALPAALVRRDDAQRGLVRVRVGVRVGVRVKIRGQG